MLLREFFTPVLQEDLSETSGTWVHYTDFPMMKVNVDQNKVYHRDPMGIYFFPGDHRPEAEMWHEKKNRFIVTLKPDTRILDLAHVTESERDAMLAAAQSTHKFAAYVGQHPTDDPHKLMRMAWEVMSGTMARRQGEWNKALRSCGWDAIFDDTGAIHSREPQLLLLNPRKIASIRQESRSQVSGYDAMLKVVKDLSDLCKGFGEVTIEGPKMDRQSSYGEKHLMAKVEVKRDDDNYANFIIYYDPKQNNNRSIIRVGLRWSRPRLEYGVGTSYNFAKGEYEFRGVEGIRGDLKRIFASGDENA